MALISRARGGGRGAAALTAAFAILVQAVLFGWHHHAIALRPQADLAVAILAAPTSPAMPAGDDHDCQICFTLGHHGAVPVALFAPSPPNHAPLHQHRLAALDAPLEPYFFFRSRAPPMA
jgi:hypothetical protein